MNLDVEIRRLGIEDEDEDEDEEEEKRRGSRKERRCVDISERGDPLVSIRTSEV